MKFLSIAIIITLIAIIVYNIVGIVNKVKLRKKQKQQECNDTVISENEDIKSEKED